MSPRNRKSSVPTSVRISVLGPLSVEVALGHGDGTVLNVNWGPGEAVIREIARDPVRGTTTQKVKDRLNRTVVHDVVSDLRKILEPYGLSISKFPSAKGGYRVVLARDGGDLDVRSDLVSFIAEAQQTLSQDPADRQGQGPGITLLRAFEQSIESVLNAWRVYDHGSRRQHLAHDPIAFRLDTDLRSALARTRVDILELGPAAALLDRARQATSALVESDPESALVLTLRARINRVAETLVGHPTTRFDVFLAAPMAAANEYDPVRKLASRLADALQQHAGAMAVYCAARTIASPDAFEEPSVALQRNVAPFQGARAFAMLLPETLPSSVLVEAGMALAWRIPAVYFVRSRLNLPWMLRDVGGAGTLLGHVRIIEYDTDDDLIRKVENAGDALFPVAQE